MLIHHGHCAPWPLVSSRAQTGYFRDGSRCRRRLLSRERCLQGSCTVCGASSAPQVLLTREKGKNGRLGELLDLRRISWLEVPLIETSVGPDRPLLAKALQEATFDWVVITSPEAASVFLEGWREAGRPQVQIAVVGEGSGRIIEAAADPELLQISFTPSKANAVHLSAELPLQHSKAATVLYPSSAKAGTDLQSGLEHRGCQVVRLNTYNTVPVASLDPKQLAAAQQAQVLAVASPSAVKAWVKLAGLQDQTDVAIACIGSTSARAAEQIGLQRIFFPDSPGLEGFVKAIEDALEAAQQPSLA